MLEKDKAVSVDTITCQDYREIPKSARVWSLLKSVSSFCETNSNNRIWRGEPSLSRGGFKTVCRSLFYSSQDQSSCEGPQEALGPIPCSEQGQTEFLTASSMQALKSSYREDFPAKVFPCLAVFKVKQLFAISSSVNIRFSVHSSCLSFSYIYLSKEPGCVSLLTSSVGVDWSLLAFHSYEHHSHSSSSQGECISFPTILVILQCAPICNFPFISIPRNKEIISTFDLSAVLLMCTRILPNLIAAKVDC